MTETMKDSPYNKHVNRELFVFGDADFRALIAKVIEPLTFISMTDMKLLKKPRAEMHFLVASADFNDTASLQRLGRLYSEYSTPNVHKVVYAAAPDVLADEHILFAAEIGSRYTTFGKDKAKDLRAYIKRVAVQSEQIGSVIHYENEISRMVRKADVKGLQALDDRLAELGRNTEDVLRLRAIINMRLSRLQRVERFLKKILSVNTQSLWAANELGRLYLITKRPAEGIAVLEKLSRFHNLNSERLLTLGDAYLNCGKAEKAAAVLQTGAELTKGEDPRFAEGVAKAKLLQGDVAGAKNSLNSASLSNTIVAFLNMRAIMDIKTGRKEEGLKLYKIALNGCANDALIRAKLNYNMGLGCIRSDKTADAVGYFEESAKLGGKLFTKARKPLEISKKVLKAAAQEKKIEETVDGEEYTFEEFNDMKAEKKAG